MSLRKYDLNLLTILDALLRHRNVTQAGQELGLTQSATSHALLRLREQFDERVHGIIQGAVDFAEQSRMPEGPEALEDLYATPVGPSGNQRS